MKQETDRLRSKGKGGKYLILPPDYKDKVPEGYIALPSQTYQGYALLRSILKSRDSIGKQDPCGTHYFAPGDTNVFTGLPNRRNSRSPTRLEFKNLFLCYYVLAVVMHCILHGDLRIGADPGASLEMERGLGREEELNDRLGGDLPHPFSLWSNLAHGKRKESLRVQPEVSDERAQPLGSMCV